MMFGQISARSRSDDCAQIGTDVEHPDCETASARRKHVHQHRKCRQRSAGLGRADTGTCNHEVPEVAGKSAERGADTRSEEHTSELQSLMRISYAVFCLKKKNINNTQHKNKKQYCN